MKMINLDTGIVSNLARSLCIATAIVAIIAAGASDNPTVLPILLVLLGILTAGSLFLLFLSPGHVRERYLQLTMVVAATQIIMAFLLLVAEVLTLLRNDTYKFIAVLLVTAFVYWFLLLTAEWYFGKYRGHEGSQTLAHSVLKSIALIGLPITYFIGIML